ncbi:MAG: hypothetical protein Q3994_00390 [Prevotella sp.]|nr:hypothetical protein [Prevotella sp.]
MIKIIQSTQEWDDFRTEWDELYKSSSVTPFQSFAFQYSSWEMLSNDNTLYIIVIMREQNKELQTIFPTYLDKNGTLRFINDKHSDFCSALFANNGDNYNTFKEFSNYILSDNQIKGVFFNNLMHSNRLLSSLRPFFKLAQVVDCNYYSVIEIYKKETDIDSIDSIRNISASRKKKLRKAIESTSCTSLKLLAKSSGDLFPDGEIECLVDCMVSKGIRSKSYFSSEMIAFWRKLYDRAVLTIGCYFESGLIHSINFMFYDKSENEYIKWIMLYRDNSDNMKLNLMLIDNIYRNGGGRINFARGIYDYKMEKFHPDVYPLFSVYLSKSKMRHLVNTFIININYLKQVVKSIIRK